MAVTPLAGGSADSDGRVLANCAALARPETLPPIADLGILTCGTPARLRRSVASWVAFARHHGRELRITVIDDSPEAGRAQAQRDAARALEAELGIRLRFAAPEDRTAIARELARLSGTETDVADFAVSGCPPPRVGIGGCRNLLSLITPGRKD